MLSPLQFYTQEKQGFEQELATLKRKLLRISTLRLFVFFIIVAGVYFFYDTVKIIVPIAVIGLSLFLFLVSIHTNLKHKKNKVQKLIDINELEINVLNGDISELDLGNEFKDPSHFFSYDIDLFGKGSFFQYLNRTNTKTGKHRLAATLTANTTEAILEKQEAIRELAEKPTWRQNYSATTSLVHVDTDTNTILFWLKKHDSFVPKNMKFLPSIFLFVSMCIFVLNYFEIAPLFITTTWFFIGLGITGLYLKKITSFYQNANRAKETFKQYHSLLELIENETFKSDILCNKQEDIKADSEKASEIFLKFSKILDAFDQRNNMLIGVLANAFALRDLQLSFKIEQWITTYKTSVEKWFEVIAFFDAQNSLANFAFNKPSYVFPTITTNKNIFHVTDLGHPLITESKRIDNSFSIKNEEFFIITGANMAGKSTFLRTVSLSIVMANIGLPVCAKTFNYTPIKLITSMRTSDSLSDDESYFFSELKRLKFIIDEINPETNNAPYFIVLDEILKGTNSTDKAIGSRKFVEKLISTKSTGIIATHDLSLCEISESLPQVKNYYFDAEIINDELHFDYSLKNGICKNMNASFLLKKMEIV